MRKKQLTKMLLVAAGLLVGSSAWADNVYTILYGVPSYDTDGTTIIGVTPQTDFTSDDGSTASDVTSEDGNGTNCTNAMPIGGSVLYSNPSFSKKFESPATKGTVHFEANYTSTTNGQETWKIVDSNGVEIFGTTDAGNNNGNGDQSWGFCNGVSLGTNWFRLARKAHNRVVLDINLTTKIVSYTVLVSSGNNSYSTLTGTYNLPDKVADVSGLTATKQSYYSYMDNVSLYNVYDDAVSEYAYTLQYQLDGTTIASETGAGAEGATVNASESIWNSENTQKYFVKEGETTSFTISSGSNTFNVAVREAEDWAYSVKAFNGTTELTTISTKSVIEGEVASYGYPQYIAVDGKLYITTKQGSNPWWGKSFTPSANNEVQEIAYSAEGSENIVFCKEAEDISGLVVVTGGNTDIRASNRSGAFASAETVITKLPAGIYKMYGAVYGNAGTTFDFKAGENVVFSLSTNGNPVHTEGEAFELTETETAITVTGGNGGNSPKVIDYIYIMRLPASESKTISSAGYATFYSKNALDFTGSGLTAYVATISGTQVSFTEVQKVPAETGVLLKGAAGDYEIPVVADGGNVESALVGVLKDTQVAAGSYVLMNGTRGVGFYKTTTEFTVGANTAYLPATTAESTRSFIGFDSEESTGISEVSTELQNGVAYDLQGRRVVNAQKGLYIVNGKKVIK